MSLPIHQRAILLNTTTDALSLSQTHPLPVPSSNEILIRVHSTAITNGELTWGKLGFLTWPLQHIPCNDVSGTIVSLGPSTTSTRFTVGDKIFARVLANRDGTAAEYATIPIDAVAKVPKGLSMVDAASVPMSAHTAWQALFEHGLLTGSFTPTSVPHIDSFGTPVLGQATGKRVLILGAAGGVGLMAVQFAKLAGATVVGTCSRKNEGYVKSMGADEIIDYHTTSIASYIASGNAKFDLVFDCAGGKSMVDGWNGVASNGVYVSVVPGFKEPEGGKPAGVRSSWFVMEPRGEELEGIGKFLEKGMLKATVDSVWKMEGFEEAFAKTATGHARGKVVIMVADE